MNGFVSCLLSIFLSIAISACGNGSTSSETGEDLPLLEIGSIAITAGVVIYGGVGNKYIRWNNYTSGESGRALVRADEHWCSPCSVFHGCYCDYTWEIRIPLLDGANDIELIYYDQSLFSSNDAAYSEVVYYAGIGPPEIIDHGEYANVTSDGSEYRYIFVLFNEYMDSSSINDSTFYLEDIDGNRMTGLFEADLLSPDGNKAVIYKTILDDIGYTAKVTTGVTDYWGTPMSIEYSWSYPTP